MALKFFQLGRTRARDSVTPPSLVEDLRQISKTLQSRIDEAIERAGPLEEEGQLLGRILDEGLQAVDGKARALDGRLDEIRAEMAAGRRRTEDTERRLREIVALLVDERSRTSQGLEAAAEATGTLRQEVNRLGRVLFRSFSASQSAIDCLKNSLEDLREESKRRDRQAAEARDLVAEVREEIQRRMIVGMLPVIDSLEEGIRHGERIAERENGEGRLRLPLTGKRNGRSKDRAAWLEGISLVRDRLERILGDEGARRIEAVGQPFDPRLHRAVGVEENGQIPPDTVIREERAGFTLGGAIIRHSEVIVSK